METWTVKVRLGSGYARCTAQRGERKFTLTYFFKNRRFVWNLKTKTLDTPRLLPSDAGEITDACLRAIAVERLTA